MTALPKKELPAQPSFRDDPEETLQLFYENGGHLERGLFTPAEVAKIKEASKTLESYKDGTFAQVMFPHRQHETFAQTIKSPKLISIMEKILKGKVDAIHSQFFFGKPGTQGFTVHQDNFFVEAPNDAFASAWLALDEIDKENGTLQVFPKSHKAGILEVRDTGSADAHRKVETIMPEKYEKPFDVIAKPGDVFFIHANVLHASYDNVSKNRFRNVLLMTFVRQGVPFRSGYHAKREIFNVYE